MSLRTKFKQWWRHRKNLGQLDSVGENVELWGEIERRAPGGRISIGAGSRIAGLLVAETDNARLTVGKNTLIGHNSIVDCAYEIEIGDDVLISYQCILADSDNHSLDHRKRKDDLERWRTGKHDWSDVAKAPIKIGRGAWIGARVIILKGVTIGEGAVVGMGSTVTKDVPPFTVVAGNPAREIRKLST